jgi:hypothetical protein
MNQKLSQLFKNIEEIKPTQGLESLIMQEISLQRAKALKRKLIFSYLGSAGSGLVMLVAIFSFGGAFWHSEFWSMTSLLFSDLMVVAGNWKTFGYSLMETFPVINVIVILIPAFALFISLVFSVSLRNKIQYTHNVHNKFKFV